MLQRLPCQCLIIFAVVILLLGSQTAVRTRSAGDPIRELQESFENPPDDCRIMMRWWWFGPSVTKEELERELELMRGAGIGGVEVQTTYPLELDDATTGIHNYPFRSDEYLDNLRFAAGRARELGLRFDVTLGSGWPYGGPSVSLAESAGMLRVTASPIANGEDSVALPAMEAGEKFLAAFLVRKEQGGIATEGAQRLSDIRDGRLWLPRAEGSLTVLFFIASHTGQQVKRPAIGAEGFVMDHYDRQATENYLHTVGDRLMQAFASNPPYAVFSDSLEVYGSDWTRNFLEEFRQRRGYDLTPYLPELVGKDSPLANDIRHDWGETLTELAEENYLKPVREWADMHGTRFRSQNYGTPPVTLSSNALVDLPEGEGWKWKGFSSVRWASSASHLYGRPVTSSETWTWLHSPAFRATPLDMKAAADTYFLEGSNQLIGHGWPYSPKSAEEPGWHFYAAGAFNEHNPWWLVMPDVTRYLQRMSFLLRQGKPVNDVALLLPTDDAWAQFTATLSGLPGESRTGAVTLGASISANQIIAATLGGETISQILDAGFNFDFIDAAAIDKVGIPYPILVLPAIEHLPLSTYRKIELYARSGGIVIATRKVPSLAPGLKQSKTDTPEVQRMSEQLFREPNARGHFLSMDSELGHTLDQLMKPDVTFSPPARGVGFVHRKLESADLYFLANTTNQTAHTQAAFRAGKEAALWDAVSGEIQMLGSVSPIDLTLFPYQSCVLVFSQPKPGVRRRGLGHNKPGTMPPALDLTTDWSVTFSNLTSNQPAKMDKLHSWTDDENAKYYSGLAQYEKVVDVPADMLKPEIAVYLDFGTGTPVAMPTAPSEFRNEGTGSGTPRAQAWLDSPVREAARVFVNGRAAGSVWLPPYELEVTKLLHAGENQFKILVGNLAINEMAGRSLPDHRLLSDRYGVRFSDQDLEHLGPLPAGVVGKLQLVARASERNKK
jgi:hypothetical protein